MKSLETNSRLQTPASCTTLPVASCRNDLIVNALPLVGTIARRLVRRLPASVTLDELISAGTIGLIKAASRFDERRGLEFHTYAKHRVRGEMLDFLRSEDPISRSERRARRECPANPNSQSGPITVSLDMVLNEASRIWAADGPQVDCLSRARMDAARHFLSVNEDRVIELSFYCGWRNREIALKMSISQGRVSQIRRRALSKLRACLR